jgi:hypothetical protein
MSYKGQRKTSFFALGIDIITGGITNVLADKNKN